MEHISVASILLNILTQTTEMFCNHLTITLKMSLYLGLVFKIGYTVQSLITDYQYIQSEQLSN